MATQARLRVCPTKPRVFVVSDISNEPDDAESLVRLLLYSNELDIQGLVACTSTWMRNNVHPEDMQRIVEAYGAVVSNLNAHVHPENQYPSGDSLLSIIKSGPAVYGLEALQAPMSSGAQLLIDRVDASDMPLWVLCWGGINTLAQVLQAVKQSRSEPEVQRFCAKLRVYTISDQDDSGAWIRVKFPDIFYICSIHAWKEYGMAAWVGIAGDLLLPLDKGGPDKTKITKEWIKENIQIGTLGRHYPDYAFIVEGDTPTLLYLIQNGLGSPENPHWGSWGGRYALTDLGGVTQHYSDVKDQVIGANGETFTSNHATIWRWRDAFQNDFAARMQWTLGADISQSNHHPVVMVNDSSPGPEPYYIEAEAGSEITLDATRTYDPDGDNLSFRWFQYKEPSSSQTLVHWQAVPDVEFIPVDKEGRGSIVKVKVPPAQQCAVNILTGETLEKGQLLHLILEVTDSGTPPLITYKRVTLQVTNFKGEGASGTKYDTITEALGHATK